MTENRGFLIQEADILLAEEDFIEHWLGKSDKDGRIMNSVNIPSDAKAVARNEILRSLLKLFQMQIFYTQIEFNKYS